MASPTDANGYIGPAPTANTFSPNFPKWMYNPLQAPIIVPDWPTEQGLLALNQGWTETPLPNSTQSFLVTALNSAKSFNSDAAAAAGGVLLGQVYRNGNFLMVRLA